MLNLSHWDFAVDFTGLQAAALILGMDPRQSSFDEIHAEPALERLRRGYRRALTFHYNKTTCGPALDEDPVTLGMLESKALIYESENVRDIYTGHDFVDWMGKDDAKFERQKFSRASLASWLKTEGLVSVYRFDVTLPMTQPSSPSEPSLSARERSTLLKLLLGMAIKGYGYDPAASRSRTAKEITDDLAAVGLKLDEDTVRSWLKQARDVWSGSSMSA